MNELALRYDLRITQCLNGYRVNYLEEIDGKTQVMEVVFEEPETEDGGKEAMKKVSWFVSEYFGVFYSKNSKTNLVHEIIEADA